MATIIDGYNLLNAAGILGPGKGPGGLKRSREALLNCLAESLSETELARTIVVFDASEAPWGVARAVSHRGLSVRFAPRDEDADTLIEELILQNSSPKSLTVVSSDHRLHRAAKRRKATPVDSDRWFAKLMQERAARHSPSPNADVVKPSGPFSPGEVEYWLREFGAEDRDSAAVPKKE